MGERIFARFHLDADIGDVAIVKDLVDLALLKRGDGARSAERSMSGNDSGSLPFEPPEQENIRLLDENARLRRLLILSVVESCRRMADRKVSEVDELTRRLGGGDSRPVRV